VDIPPDEYTLMLRAGADMTCEHEWTSAGEGGCTENPGVWALGGTTIRISDHCQHCGLQRTRTLLGSQRNPGEHDTVSFSMPVSEEEQ